MFDLEASLLKALRLERRIKKSFVRMASKACKRKKGATRVVIRPLDGESAVGQRRRGISGTFEYQDEDAPTADFQQPRGGGWSSDEVVVEDILVCIFCNWEASSFPKLSHHVGYVHKVGYQFWCDLVKKNYHVLRKPAKSDVQPIAIEPVMTAVPRIPRGRRLCGCHPLVGGGDGLSHIHSELASGRRYIYHDLDGISYVRKTTSRQIQWGRVPRVVFEVRTPGEMPMYLIGDRWGGEYVHELPENFPPPGHIVGL